MFKSYSQISEFDLQNSIYKKAKSYNDPSVAINSLYKMIAIQPENVSYLENINYFFKNVINISIIEFKAIIKQSIPETAPIYYAETNLKIFNN